jgi:hypothetical protein
MIVVFFRDILDGWVYVLWVVVLLFAELAIYGIVADRKREVIKAGLLAKKQRDIESGKEAEKAALADKQVLDVMEDEEEDLTKKEEAPQVLVIGEDGADNSKK